MNSKLRLWKGSYPVTNATYLRRRSWNIIPFSLLLIIIIIIKYTGSIYLDCMRLPRPMNDYEFDNEYDVILHTWSSTFSQLEQKVPLCAATCICWLASRIQVKEILLYYQHYKLCPVRLHYELYSISVAQNSYGSTSTYTYLWVPYSRRYHWSKGTSILAKKFGA